MEDIKKIPDGIEVDKPVMKQGEVKAFSWDAMTNKPPRKLDLVLNAIMYFCTGLIATVAGSDLFTGYQSKVICFILAVIVLACGACKVAIGVVPKDISK
jgi:uncharacterized membrane protein YphA (DoxX/SURF4 family)